MSEHTPSDEEMRDEFINLQGTFANGSWEGGSLDRWNRWITERDARIKAAAEQRGAARGWDEAMTTQVQRLISGDPDAERFQMPANPYRADRLEDDDA